MTSKQLTFAKEYIANQANGTKAALTAYGTNSRSTAATIAYENLRKPQILKRIAELSAPQDEELKSRRERVLGELEAIAFASVGKVKISDKTRALELLGRYEGLWLEQPKQTKQLTFVLTRGENL